MRLTSRFLSFAVVTLAFALPASAGEMEDEQEIHRIVETRWEMQAEKKVMDGLFGPNGVTQAFSSGGLWGHPHSCGVPVHNGLLAQHTDPRATPRLRAFPRREQERRLRHLLPGGDNHPARW